MFSRILDVSTINTTRHDCHPKESKQTKTDRFFSNVFCLYVLEYFAKRLMKTLVDLFF